MVVSNQARQHSEHLDGRVPPQFISLKQVLVSSNIPSKKQIVILNKKEDGSEVNNHESRNTTLKDGQGFTTGFLQSQTSLQPKKVKIDKVKNVYSPYPTKGNELNSYTDFGIKGMRPRLNNGGFAHSRNSQLSSNSSNQHEINLATYGAVNQTRNSNQMTSKASFKESTKNSYQNTQTSSFGVKQSFADNPQMEVRGNNLGVSLSMFNKSSYNKFVPNQKMSKRSGG